MSAELQELIEIAARANELAKQIMLSDEPFDRLRCTVKSELHTAAIRLQAYARELGKLYVKAGMEVV